MKKQIFYNLIALIFLIFFSLAPMALAADLGGLEETRNKAGYKNVIATNVGIVRYIGIGISAISAFVGVVFMALIWNGAFDIFWAGGNEEKVKSGRDKIKNGAIGILIVFSAYVLAYTLLSLISGGAFKIFKI
ncbi:MAG: hypothetical protein PHT51_00620 [Patescibacteria group bacterium]|nr:hypothetical protein [Patescibacteria group bacterium]MDD4610727.1 hypothetical protein [Patescibacteria group bacterium]